MGKFRLVAAAAIAGVITLLSSGAQAALYPDCGITLTLNNSTVVGGEKFSFTADAGDVECDWTVTYAGKTKTGSGTSLSGTFSTKKVSEKTTTKITAKCVHEVNSSLSSSTASTDVTPAFYSSGSTQTLQSADRTCPVSADVTLLPKGAAPDDEEDGVLPDTGGANFWLLVIGGVLVLGGAGITYASRRRHTSR